MLAAGLLAFTAFYYVAVYTIWLKPRTPQNIVIGGAAGAFPPMIGWIAVTGSVDPMAIVLFMIILLWTPPHSWALALFRDDDYAAAGIPMLPVVAGITETKRQIVIYTALLLPVTFAPVLLGSATVVYAATAASGMIWFVWRVWQLVEAPAGETLHRAGKTLFANSIGYLFALFLALVVDRFAVWLLVQFGG
jgi:protoheme IX farnesyltransferase